jgi:hypothetical protein
MQALTFFFAFVAVLCLIGLAAWLVRRFAGNRLGANTNRGRMPRLAVIDAAAVDGRRRLVLVRRDNIEHLLMIGGPTDIVVESNIVRAMPARDQLPPRPGVPAAEPPQLRVAPLPDAGWTDGDGQRTDTRSIITPSRKCPSRRRARRGPPSPTKCAARRRHCRNVAANRCAAIPRATIMCATIPRAMIPWQVSRRSRSEIRLEPPWEIPLAAGRIRGPNCAASRCPRA